MKAITYLIYILLYEALTIGGTAYIVFWLHYSAWWWVLGALFSAGAYRPEKWMAPEATQGGNEK